MPLRDLVVALILGAVLFFVPFVLRWADVRLPPELGEIIGSALGLMFIILFGWAIRRVWRAAKGLKNRRLNG